MDATLDREEGRHAIVIRDYLTVTRAVDPFALERERMAHVSRGYYPAAADNPLDGLVYVTLQELATRIAHRNTGVASSDRIAAAGIYDLPIHHDQVLCPVVRTHFRLDSLAGLRDAAEAARDEVLAFLARLDASAAPSAKLRATADEPAAAPGFLKAGPHRRSQDHAVLG